MQKISWEYKITSAEVLPGVNQIRSILDSIQKLKCSCLLHCDALLRDVLEGRAKGRPTGRRT